MDLACRFGKLRGGSGLRGPGTWLGGVRLRIARRRCFCVPMPFSRFVWRIERVTTAWNSDHHFCVLVMSLLLGFLPGCSAPDKDACRWIFERADGQVLQGTISIAGTEEEVKPWKEATDSGTGTLRVYYPDGALYQAREYAGGKLSGSFRVWFPNGRMSQDVQYSNGVQQGQMTLWHPNGQRASQANYQDGKFDGIYLEWYPTSKPQSQTRYSRGVLDGPARSWSPAGDIVEDGVWRNMQPWNGRLVLYKRTGEAPVVGVYSNGVLVGRCLAPSEGAKGPHQ